MQPMVTDNMPSPVAADAQDKGEPHLDWAGHWDAAGTCGSDTPPPLAERRSSTLTLSPKRSVEQESEFEVMAKTMGWEAQYRVYQKIAQQHPAWLDEVWNAAEDRARYGPQGLVPERHTTLFLYALLTVAVEVEETGQELDKLHDERPQVELHSSELADQTVSDAAVREQLSPALDQTAGMDNPNIALLWTLQRGHNTFRPDGASESCYDRLCRERKEAILSSLTIAKFSNESMQDAVKLQQEFEIGFTGSATGGGFNYKAPTSLPLQHMITQSGQELLSKRLEDLKELEQLCTAGPDNVLGNACYFRCNPNFIGAWIKEEEVLEIYEYREAKKGHTVCKLVNIIHGCKSSSEWSAITVQDFRLSKDGAVLEFCPDGGMDKTLYTVPARRKRDHFFGAPYIKARPAGSALERSVSKCLAERGLQGGGWSTVLNGRLTGSTQETGFCRMPVCAALAGLALFFSSKVDKSCYWLTFDNVHLDSKAFAIGHCDVRTDQGGRSKACNVQLIAANDSPLWGRRVWWG